MELQIEIQQNCSLSCSHCSSARSSSINRKKYLKNDLKKFLSLFKNTTQIYLTGGEPLLQPDLLSLMGDIQYNNSNIKIGLFTSGILIYKNCFSSISPTLAQEYFKAGLESCYVSIYHSDSSLHEKITQIPNSLKHTISSIKNLKSMGIEIKVHLVLNRYNINNISQIIDFFIDIGVSEVRLLRLVRTGNAKKNWKEVGVDYEVQNRIIEEIFQKKEKYKVKVTFSGFPSMTPCRPEDDAIKCQAATKLFYITYSGDIYPCACTMNVSKFRIGNISHQENFIEYQKKHTQDHNEECLNPISVGE